MYRPCYTSDVEQAKYLIELVVARGNESQRKELFNHIGNVFTGNPDKEYWMRAYKTLLKYKTKIVQYRWT